MSWTPPNNPGTPVQDCFYRKDKTRNNNFVSYRKFVSKHCVKEETSLVVSYRHH